MCQRTISGEMVSLCPSMNWFVSRYAYRTGGSFQESLKKERQQHPESPRRARSRACCAPPLRSVLTAPGFPDRASPFQSSMVSTAPQPCPSLVGRRDGLPGGYGRKRDSRRTVRIRGGVVITIACAFHRASNAVPGVLVSEANEGGSRDAKRLSSCGKSPIVQQLRTACSPDVRVNEVNAGLEDERVSVPVD